MCGAGVIRRLWSSGIGNKKDGGDDTDGLSLTFGFGVSLFLIKTGSAIRWATATFFLTRLLLFLIEVASMCFLIIILPLQYSKRKLFGGDFLGFWPALVETYFWYCIYVCL